MNNNPTCPKNSIFAIISINIVGAFTLPPGCPRHPSLLSLSSPPAAKSICTFDESDFAGKQGDWPYTAADLNRLDNSDDSVFYDSPRFVTHIDDSAISSLTQFYQQEFASMNKESLDILDLCSSWISHLPPQDGINYRNVIGVGMNERELTSNKQLTDFIHYWCLNMGINHHVIYLHLLHFQSRVTSLRLWPVILG